MDRCRWWAASVATFPVAAVFSSAQPVPQGVKCGRLKLAPRVGTGSTFSDAATSLRLGGFVVSSHTFDLDHDRKHAAICMRASQLICRRGLTSSADEHTTLAVGQLLHAVSFELTADGHSVPLSVRRAALRVADSLESQPSARFPFDRVSADRVWSTPKTCQARDVPFTACIRLGRMG